MAIIAKAYLYTRISTLQQAGGYGIERQQSAVIDFLNEAVLPTQLGYTVSSEYYEMLEPDLGRSAFKGHNFEKGSLGGFKKRVLNNEIVPPAIMVIESVDRFSRLPDYEAIAEFNTLISAGIDIYEVETGNTYSTKIDGSLSKLSHAIERAHAESKRKSGMAKKSWENRRRKLKEQGQALLTNHPRWLQIVDNKYQVNELAPVILKMYEMYAEGYGTTVILKMFNDANLLDNGNLWNTVSTHRILSDVRVTGVLEVGRGRDKLPKIDENGKKIVDGKGKTVYYIPTETVRAYPEIVPEALFNRVRRMMESKSIANTHRTTRFQRNLFNGISRCGLCGEAMIADRNGHGKLFLVCLGRRAKKGCTAQNIPYEVVERELLIHANGLTFEQQDVPEQTELLDQVKDLESDIEELESELNDADDAVVLALVRVIKNKKAVLQKLQDELTGITIQASNVKFDVSVLSDQENVKERQVANVLIKKVVKRITFFREGDNIYTYLDYHIPNIRHMLQMSAKRRELIYASNKRADGVLRIGFLEIDKNAEKQPPLPSEDLATAEGYLNYHLRLSGQQLTDEQRTETLRVLNGIGFSTEN